MKDLVLIKSLINKYDKQINNVLMHILTNRHLKFQIATQCNQYFSTNSSLFIEFYKTQVKDEVTQFKLKKFIIDLVSNHNSLEKIYHKYTEITLDSRFINAYKATPYSGATFDSAAVDYTKNFIFLHLKSCTNSADVYAVIEILAMKNIDPFDPLIKLINISPFTPLFLDKFRYAYTLNAFINTPINFPSPVKTLTTELNSINKVKIF